MELSGWGRFPKAQGQLHSPRTESELAELVAQGPLIARGNGRGYGDCGYNPHSTVDMRGFNKLIAFDAATGLLVAEAGVLLGDVIRAFLPRGWFPAVTPGTQYVTLGGMAAADVHGKNHHQDGSFARCVEWIDLLDTEGQTRRLSRTENPALFALTLGGMGLTGVILRLALRLRRVETGWIKQTTLPAANLAEAIALFESHLNAPYSVAWIDCLSKGDKLGRAAVMLGEHARLDDLPDRSAQTGAPAVACPKAADRAAPFAVPQRPKIAMPLNLPQWALNRLSVRSFNALYYRNACCLPREKLVSWESYFYPLDAIGQWNRMYGAAGFAQYQCVLPLATSHAGLSALLSAIAQSGQGSFLAVLKRMGPEDGPVSFPMEGYTLALDFPVNLRTLALMERLDAITLNHAGRFYLAKDARMSAATLRLSDPRMARFRNARARGGMTSFHSSQSERLDL